MSNVRRRKVRAWGAFLLTFFVSLGAATAFANSPEPDPDGNPNTLLNVVPSDNLTDGQEVQVSGSGFSPNSGGDLTVCTTGDAQICDDGLGGIGTDANGNFGPVTLSIPQTFSQETGTGPVTIDCAVVECRLNAVAGISFASHSLSFSTGPTTTSTSTSTTLLPTTTSTSTSTTLLPTTTSTSTSTTLLPTTTSTSTTTTLLPTTTSSSTTTTLLPTTTSSSTTTTLLPTTTSSTVVSSTTTTIGTTPTTLCDQLRAARASFNAQIDQVEQSLARSLSGDTLQRAIALVEQARAQGNALLDAQIARCQ